MGAVIPRVITPSSASGAQVIDGSLKFEGGYLTRTPSTNGNRRTWTYSAWVKFDNNVTQSEPLLCAGDSSSDFTQIYTYKTLLSDIALSAKTSSSDKVEITSLNRLRDTGWYHIVAVFDSTGSGYQTDTKLYVNGVEITRNTNTYAGGQNYDSWVNSTSEPHYIGHLWNGNDFKGYMSQAYLIDGQALDASDFGYTDPLTNTWRPKKFAGSYTTTSINDGTNWSALNTNGNTGLQPWSKAFNGTGLGATGGSDFAQGSQSAGLFYWEYATGIPISSSLRVYLMNGYPGWATEGFVCNDNTYSQSDLSTAFGTLSSQTGGWMTIAEGVHGGSLKKLGCATSSNSDYQTRVVAVEIDGVILIDSVDWRGVNSFYLPFDGSAPIGTDQSGRGNDWRQVNFGGSLALDKATGALPIRNTVNGGKVAGVGLRKDYSPHTANIVKESGCVRFDGTGDVLYAADSTDFTLGTNDFTAECWIYRTRTGVDEWFFCQGDGVSSNTSFGLHIDASTNYLEGRLQNATAGSQIDIAGTTALTTCVWYHCAWVRDGSTVRLYLNGVQEKTASIGSDTAVDSTSTMNVGALMSNGTNGTACFLSNVRLVNGTCLYPDGTTFIPPTEPLTAVTNTKLLCCQSATDATAYTVSPGALTKVGDTYATDSESSGSCVLALPLVGDALDVSNKINSESTAKTTTVTNAVGITTISNFYSGSYFFDGSGDYIVVTNNSEFVFEEEPFTIECWMYADSYMGLTYPTVISKYDNGDASWILRLKSDGDIVWYAGQVGGGTNNESTTQPISLGRWIHLAVVRKGTGSNETKVYVDGLLQLTCTDSSDYDDTNNIYIGRQDSSNANEFDGYIQDVRIYKGVEKYTSDFIPASTNPYILPDTPSGVALGSELTKLTHGSGGVKFDGTSDVIYAADSADFTLGTNDFTAECWIKRNRTSVDEWFFVQGDGVSTNTSFGLHIDATTNYLEGRVQNGDAGSSVDIAGTTALGTDVWYHCAWVRDGGNMRLYLNGVQENSSTSLGSASVQDSTSTMNVGALMSNGTASTACVLSNARLVNGTCLYPDGTTFDPPREPLTAVTNTKFLCCQSPTDATAYTVSPGALTKVNDAVATYSTPFTTDVNTVMGQETGYVTLNPLREFDHNCNLSNGNLTATGSSDTYPGVAANISLTSGKWYYEFVINTKASNPMCGVIQNNYWSGGSGRILYRANGDYVLSTGSEPTDPSTFDVGDIIGVVIDLDDTAGYIRFYKNGVLEPVVSGLSALKSDLSISTLGGLLPYIQMYPNDVCTVNFGQQPFRFPPPAGFQPLNLANLPSPGVVRSDTVVGVTTYAGNGGTQFVSPGNFSPDMVWMKGYTEVLQWRNVDTVRGQYQLKCNSDAEQAAWSSIGWLPGQKGYNITDDGNEQNKTGAAYVSYGWKAGGNPGISTTAFWTDDKEDASAAAAGLDGGTITPIGASVGTQQGFSIIKYRGNGTSGGTLSHGLSQTPDFFIIKSTEYQYNWNVYHQAMGNTHLIRMNTTAVKVTESGAAWNDTSPTSSVITFGNLGGTNQNTAEYMAYIWHDVPGLQKFGTWDNNGEDDGTFVELGFRPAILLLKCTDATEEWYIINDDRYPNNLGPGSSTLVALQTSSTKGESGTVAMAVNAGVDFLSNGFKIRSTDTTAGEISYGTRNYIYAAWAHQPRNDLYGAQSNAR